VRGSSLEEQDVRIRMCGTKPPGSQRGSVLASTLWFILGLGVAVAGVVLVVHDHHEAQKRDHEIHALTERVEKLEHKQAQLRNEKREVLGGMKTDAESFDEVGASVDRISPDDELLSQQEQVQQRLERAALESRMAEIERELRTPLTAERRSFLNLALTDAKSRLVTPRVVRPGRGHLDARVAH